MRQIKNGFSERYFLTEQALVYDSQINKTKQPYEGHMYKLYTCDNKLKSISQKSLYKMVYGKQYCIDNTISAIGQEWKSLNEEQSYWISNYGNIKSYKYYICDRFLEPSENSKGYLRVELSMNGKAKKYFVHALVADKFLQKKDNKKYQIHHIDTNKQNNHYSNLKYVTPQEHRKIHEQIRKNNDQKKCI